MTFTRNTPYHSRQAALGAEFVDRVGFAAAYHYGSIAEEHKATREAVGIFDVYYQVMIAVIGPDAAAFLDGLSVNDIAGMAVGGVRYTSICNADGGMIDDLTVFRFSETEYRLAPTPTRVGPVLAWLERNRGTNPVAIVNLGYRDAYLSVQGPQSRALLQSLTDADLGNDSLRYFQFTQGAVAGIPGAVISRTGYSGELGFELFYPSEYAGHLWDTVVAAGKAHGLRPCGLGALVTLRMEKKYPLYGLDISEASTPIEADLGWTFRAAKGDFIGRERIAEQAQNGTERRLVLLSADDLAPTFAIGDAIEAEGRKVGAVTSAAKGHTVGKSLAMGYVETGFDTDGLSLVIASAGGERVPVTLHRKPVYDPAGERARS
ncbi:glycine cleavage system aminomethyltransferase GcvT [Shinella pollutisoli]|uniref:aminomethyltransferase n=1 Tax=Shinella pollutisoli TaxID=2250594 RepID=A0ABV7DI02_9HYPH|nr:glycine cleavage system aminomethyltransferase GcvT [Shinella pollutisoli]